MSNQNPPSNNYNYSAYAGDQGGTPPPAAIPERPKQVEISFWLLIVGLVLSLVTIPIGIAAINSPENRTVLEKQLADQGTAVNLDDALAVATGIVVIIAVLSAAVTILVAVFIRKGYNWARIVLTVFAVLSLLNLVNPSAANLTAIAASLLTIAATVLLYLKPAPEYFTGMKQYRLSRKFGHGS